MPAFDNDKYIRIQSEHIRERIAQFGNKLYLELGGKLFDDLHASRVLPGFLPDSKLRMLTQLSDLLEIEARLTEVRYQLENYASTLRLYDNQVDYATVSLYITEVEKYTPVEELGFWQRIGSGLADSVENLAKTIVDFISWLIIDLPYLALIGLMIWGITAITKRSIRKRKAKKEKTEK